MPRSNPNPRLADVARAAGVSLATASRALSEPGMVRDDTRGRVEQAVAMLGYVPHGAARALATSRTRTIGAVFPPVDNPIFAGATHALAQELAAAGYTLLLASYDYDLGDELAAVRALVGRGADGMVLVGLDHRPETLAVLERAGVPWEITWSLDESGRHHCIGFSHRSASIRVTQHLLDLGHREIAVIAGDTKRNDRARERLAGVKDALAARGVKLPAEARGRGGLLGGQRPRGVREAPGARARFHRRDRRQRPPRHRRALRVPRSRHRGPARHVDRGLRRHRARGRALARVSRPCACPPRRSGARRGGGSSRAWRARACRA